MTREPLALEELAVVGDLPVAVHEPLALGGRELGERLEVGLGVEVRVVGDPRGQVDGVGMARLGVDEALLDPGMSGAAGVTRRAHPQRHVGERGAVGRCGATLHRRRRLAQHPEHAPVVAPPRSG